MSLDRPQPWEPRLPRPSRPDAKTRIGDADRDRAATALGEHYAAGRLTREELDARLGSVLAARTAADLEPLFADLPDPAPVPAARAVPPRGVSAARYPVAVPLLPLLLALAVILTVTFGVPPFLFVPFAWMWLGRRHRAWHRGW
jgi:uncharacterized protein DUF1707